jgi:hypothetical protein
MGRENTPWTDPLNKHGHPTPRRKLEEEFGGNVEAAAEALDVVLVEFAFAAENLGDDAGGAEDVGQGLLQEAVLVHEQLKDFERLGAGKLVVAVFEILDQEGQEFGKVLFGRGELAAATVQFIKKRGASFLFLLGANHAASPFLPSLL